MLIVIYSILFQQKRLEYIRYVEKNEDCTTNDIREFVGCSVF